MAIGNELGEFSLKLTNVSYAEDGSSVSADFEGTATDFGTTLGTVCFRLVPGEKGGTCSWRGQSFLDNGDQAFGAGEGTWEEDGTKRWRIRAIVQISGARRQTLATDGHFDLTNRSYNGKILDWS